MSEYNDYNRDVFNPGANQSQTIYEDTTVFSDTTSYSATPVGLTEALASEVVNKSFLFMFAALAITAFAALTTSPMMAYRLMTGNGFYAILIAEFAVVFISGSAIKKNKPVLAGILYTVYAYLTGYTFAVLFLAFEAGSIASTFITTSLMFLVMALFGLVTKKDLSGIGSYCLMALVGIIIASVVNVLFVGSLGFEFVISLLGVFIFVGLTAYDVQKIKNRVAISTDETVLCLAMYGGFELYLDFINLFLKLLRLMGKRK